MDSEAEQFQLVPAAAAEKDEAWLIGVWVEPFQGGSRVW